MQKNSYVKNNKLIIGITISLLTLAIFLVALGATFPQTILYSLELTKGPALCVFTIFTYRDIFCSKVEKVNEENITLQNTNKKGGIYSPFLEKEI